MQSRQKPNIIIRLKTKKTHFLTILSIVVKQNCLLLPDHADEELGSFSSEKQAISPRGNFWWDEITTTDDKWLLFRISFSPDDILWWSDNFYDDSWIPGMTLTTMVKTCWWPWWQLVKWRPVDDTDNKWWRPVDDPWWWLWQPLWWQCPVIMLRYTSS